MKLPTTIKELKAFAYAANIAKHPDVPSYAVPTPVMSDSSTNALTKAVIYDMTNVRKGIPDIIGIIKGRFFGIEIKFGADRQSAEQRIIELEIKAVGGVYLIVRTYRQYVESMNELSRDSR